MTIRIRFILAFSILAIVLAACSATAGAPTSEAPEASAPADPSVEPSVAPSETPEPSEPADEEREVAGTITVAEMAISGPGATIQEALDAGPQGDLPSLVNGVLFRDLDGSIYLATSVDDVDAPSFDGPMLQVLNMENDGPSWDLANAEVLGLEEANGIVFNQNAQVLGFLELP